MLNPTVFSINLYCVTIHARSNLEILATYNISAYAEPEAEHEALKKAKEQGLDRPKHMGIFAKTRLTF